MLSSPGSATLQHGLGGGCGKVTDTLACAPCLCHHRTATAPFAPGSLGLSPTERPQFFPCRSPGPPEAEVWGPGGGAERELQEQLAGLLLVSSEWPTLSLALGSKPWGLGVCWGVGPARDGQTQKGHLCACHLPLPLTSWYLQSLPPPLGCRPKHLWPLGWCALGTVAIPTLATDRQESQFPCCWQTLSAQTQDCSQPFLSSGCFPLKEQ